MRAHAVRCDGLPFEKAIDRTRRPARTDDELFRGCDVNDSDEAKREAGLPCSHAFANRRPSSPADFFPVEG